MSVSSMGGQFGLGPQTAKGAVATTFYKFRATRVAGGLVTVTEPMPPEVSGVPIADGVHSLGAYYASQVDLIPRAEGDLGWLLYALCGDVSTIPDSPETGVNTHIFRMDSTDFLALQWLTTRRVIPGSNSTNLGEQALDTRVSAAAFQFNAAARLQARLSLYGLQPSFADDISGWTWVDDPEGADSVLIPSTAQAHFQLPISTGRPVNAATVTIGNQVSQPQDEFIIGSPYPDDAIALYRNVAIEAAYKWVDATLYKQLVANGGTGASIDWSPVVYHSTFSVKEVSPGNIGVTSTPYSIEIRAEKVYWFPSGAPEIAGVNIIRLPLQGLVARPSSGDAFQIRLVNAVESYTWPS